MNLIKIKALSPEGTNAINNVMETKTSRKERLIYSKVFKEKVINKFPLEIHIFVKIQWLAVQINILDKIKEHLEKKYNAIENVDYLIEVE